MIFSALSVIVFASLLIPAFADSNVEMSGALLDSPFNMHINETTIIESENIIVKLQNITDDSRCPSDVTCAWQGTAHADISIKKNDAAKFINLELGKIDTLFDYAITFQKLEPYPKTTKPIEQNQYIATFALTKSKEMIPPLDQFRAGTAFDDIKCKENMVLIMKSSDKTPACVSQKTKIILIERGWAANQ